MTYKELPKYCVERVYCEILPRCPYKSLCSRFYNKYGLIPSKYYKENEEDFVKSRINLSMER